MRKLSQWSPRESWCRFLNAASWPSTEFTLQDLHKFDGKSDSRVYFSPNRVVFDASASPAFRDAYEQWAGRDATVALATMSMDPHDIDRQDHESLTPSERESLDSWVAYFDQKYRRVGKLAEHAGVNQR
jgi:predicted heme/steroid binding protein